MDAWVMVGRGEDRVMVDSVEESVAGRGGPGGPGGFGCDVAVAATDEDEDEGSSSLSSLSGSLATRNTTRSAIFDILRANMGL